MTKARDLSNIISGGFTESDIPNLSASKITSGQFADARIADLNASKLTGSIADARVPASAVSQHATSFDDNKIVNDISTLAIRQASNENKGAYNTSSMYVDVFQDGTGIASNTNAPRNASEYVNTGSTVTDNNFVFALDMTSSTPTALYSGSTAMSANGGQIENGTQSGSPSTNVRVFNNNNTSYWRWNDSDTFNLSGDFAIDYWIYVTTYNASARLWSKVTTGGSAYEYYLRPGGQLYVEGRGSMPETTLSTNTWYYICLEAHGNNFNKYINGNRVSQVTMSSANNNNTNANMYVGGAWFGDSHAGSQNPQIKLGAMRFTKQARYNSASTITVPTGELTDQTSSLSATGNFISNVITAPSSVSKMGAIVTYENTSGTNTLNTDIILQLSADNGSNFTTATLTAMPDFATGIKMAKVNDLSVTAGTQLKYKISFANQSSGSKEARIRGVSLQY